MPKVFFFFILLLWYCILHFWRAACDIADGSSSDGNGNGIPDECECLGDLDGDGAIGLSDLAQLLANYGTTNGAEYEDGDLDGDGDVDLSDLAGLLSVYGTTCER